MKTILRARQCASILSFPTEVTSTRKAHPLLQYYDLIRDCRAGTAEGGETAAVTLCVNLRGK